MEKKQSLTSIDPTNTEKLPTRKEKHKKHVIILGNGFDRYIGRPTSYADFYNSDSNYCPKNYPAPLIKYLNETFKDNIEDVRWYDLENELLKYCSINYKLDPINDREKTIIKQLLRMGPLKYSSINGELKRLLQKEIIIEENSKCKFPYEKFPFDLAERDKYAFYLIVYGFRKYLNSIINEENILINKNKYEKGVSKYLPLKRNLDQIVYSFNFTPSIFPKEVKYNYVHGSCKDDNIIIGTKEFDVKEEYRFLQKSFDPKYEPASVSYALLDANEVSIFGHSLGSNDRQYFEAFFKRQCNPEKAKRKMKITIYTKDQNSINELKRSLQELTGYHLSDLQQYSDLKFVITGNLTFE